MHLTVFDLLHLCFYFCKLKTGMWHHKKIIESKDMYIFLL